ncbi:MAG: hypothetical protein H6509_04130 [Bryobacterales bacterium]|nr:hypothetical protein [Bryobacterales bacterium]
MLATVNRLLFTTTVFDSGSLGMLTSVIHQFSEPGVYQAAIRQNGASAGTRSFEVVAEGGEMQLNVDLARSKTSEPHTEDCGCKSARGSLPKVSAKGFVLFYVSQGQGYSVRAGLADAGEKAKAAFDSETLGKGDLFALSLLEPAKFSMANRKGGAKGEIVVSVLSPQPRRMEALDPTYVEVGDAGFKPAKLKVSSTQGIIFRMQAAARIVIERQGADRKGDTGPRRPVRFTPIRPKAPKPEPAKAAKAK